MSETPSQQSQSTEGKPRRLQSRRTALPEQAALEPDPAGSSPSPCQTGGQRAPAPAAEDERSSQNNRPRGARPSPAARRAPAARRGARSAGRSRGTRAPFGRLGLGLHAQPGARKKSGEGTLEALLPGQRLDILPGNANWELSQRPGTRQWFGKKSSRQPAAAARTCLAWSKRPPRSDSGCSGAILKPLGQGGSKEKHPNLANSCFFSPQNMTTASVPVHNLSAAQKRGREMPAETWGGGRGPASGERGEAGSTTEAT